MDCNLTVESTVEALRSHGDARESTGWADGEPNYVAEYSLTAEHIPALIDLATQWVDDQLDDETLFGPVHAWRALGQLRAVEAVQPLLDMQDELADLGDDWYLEEFHNVFGLIGLPAIEPLTAYLADNSHAESPRAKAGSGLREIARLIPEIRTKVVAILTVELGRFQDLSDLNGLLICDLLDLNAVESAETVERAFAANVVDPTIAGDWGDVRKELGVAGLGIAPDRTPGWTTIRERLGLAAPGSARKQLARDEKQRQDAKHQTKLKRKQRKQKKKDRKRNRKPR